MVYYIINLQGKVKILTGGCATSAHQSIPTVGGAPNNHLCWGVFRLGDSPRAPNRGRSGEIPEPMDKVQMEEDDKILVPEDYLFGQICL